MSDLLSTALRFLPHGPEFRFLDRLIDLDPGRHGTGEYTVKGDEPFLRGHFPGEPLMPGVLLLEAAAQLAGVVAQSDPGLPPLAGLKLTALRGVKILGTAKPGETVRVEATIAGRMDHLIQAQASAVVAGQLVLKADLTLSGVR
jgi:3-hydroxyacyl-[acyl-carrier-protein] dehydratase